jgi:hypothetical protein
MDKIKKSPRRRGFIRAVGSPGACARKKRRSIVGAEVERHSCRTGEVGRASKDISILAGLRMAAEFRVFAPLYATLTPKTNMSAIAARPAALNFALSFSLTCP